MSGFWQGVFRGLVGSNEFQEGNPEEQPGLPARGKPHPSQLFY